MVANILLLLLLYDCVGHGSVQHHAERERHQRLGSPVGGMTMMACSKRYYGHRAAVQSTALSLSYTM